MKLIEDWEDWFAALGFALVVLAILFGEAPSA